MLKLLSSQPLKRSLALLGLLLPMGCSFAPAPAPTTAAGDTCAPAIAELEFGISSSESQQSLKQQWEPFLAALSDHIVRPVNGFYATDYAAVIEAMGADKLHVAWYGGKAYIEAAKRSGAEAFVRTVN
ncbi:MAG: PhnD/SsuA/transferrin family substrate-binding protein, partial [Elainellaceae cyanobacterium]